MCSDTMTNHSLFCIEMFVTSGARMHRYSLHIYTKEVVDHVNHIGGVLIHRLWWGGFMKRHCERQNLGKVPFVV